MEGKRKYDIQHPEVWELLVLIDERRVDYILFTPTIANSLIMGNLELHDDSLQALEDAIYDTPELLDSYSRVRVIVHSRHFVMMPGDAADSDCLAMLGRTFPDDDGDTAVCPMPAAGVKVAYTMPRGMQAFLGRTFSYPVLCHHLVPLCEHFKGLDRAGGIARMFLNLRPGTMDMAIYRDGALQCANSYAYATPEDAAYFALNAWRLGGLDQLSDEMQLLGDNNVRNIMLPVLRKYVKYVMPAIYPATALRVGRNAMQAPLELILLALCE